MSDEENFYLPYIVYKNLEIFLKYRNLLLVSSAIVYESKNHTRNNKINTSFLDQKTFTQEIQFNKYILIEAKDGENLNRKFNKNISSINKKKIVKTFILLMDIYSIHVSSTQNFTKCLGKIPGFNDSNRDFNLDIIVIIHEDINVHLRKKVDNLITDGGDNDGYININIYNYHHFTSIIPEHELVAKHKLLSKSDEKEIIDELNTDKKNLPKIRKEDPVAIWYGLNINDIVEVLYTSEACGYETKYLNTRA